MVTFVTIIHAIFAIALTTTVLMQSGKSAGLSGAITGGAEHVFGKKKGMDDLLNRFSTVFAILFIVTSLILVYLEQRA